MARWIVGLAPPDSAKLPHVPMTGRTGRRLSSWAGLGGTTDKLHETFRCVNLLPTPLLGVNANRRQEECYAEADRLRARLLPGDSLVLLGRMVMRSFHIPRITPWCTWVSIHGVEDCIALVLPHPSGLTRYYNDADNLERATKALTCAAKHLPL